MLLLGPRAADETAGFQLHTVRQRRQILSREHVGAFSPAADEGGLATDEVTHSEPIARLGWRAAATASGRAAPLVVRVEHPGDVDLFGLQGRDAFPSLGLADGRGLFELLCLVLERVELRTVRAR